MTIARRLYVVLGVMVLLITGELSALWFTINTLSSVRAYVAGEGIWSKAERDCLYHLEAYGRTRDPREYEAYQQTLTVWAGDHQANLGFRSTAPDTNKQIFDGMLRGGNSAEDIPGMIDLFRRFNSISFIAEAIRDWTAGDFLMIRFQELATQLHGDVEREDSAAITKTLSQISDLNVRLTVIENHFSNTLGEGSRWLTGLVLRVLLGAALLVELTGLFLTFSITRNISMRLTAMLHASERVSQGDFAVRLDERRRDEIGLLAEAFNDMTVELERERKRAEEAIAAREISLREAERMSHIGVWDWAFTDDAISWSKEVCRLHGMAADDARLTLAEFLGHVDPEDVWRVQRDFEAARASGEPLSIDYRILLADGSRRWLSADARVDDDDGRPERMFGTTRDITQRKADEERIHSLNQELEHRYAELETFSYSVAHDLRGPLRTVAGFANALEEDYAGELNGEAKRFIASINRGAIHMGSLIDALLSLASVSRQEISPLSVDLTAKANAIVANLQAADPKRQATVIVQEGMRAAGDSALLTTMLANLLGNAWKFTRDRDPAVIRFEAEKRGEETVYAVTDNGIGFPTRTSDNLFTPFKRLHGERFEGTGIGLATVARIVQRHGGRVWAESSPGSGATFRFTLSNGVRPSAQ